MTHSRTSPTRNIPVSARRLRILSLAFTVFTLVLLPVGATAQSLELWLDGSDPNGDGSASGSTLITWVDKSGNDRHPVNNSNPPDLPDFIYSPTALNGRGAVRFEGHISQIAQIPLDWSSLAVGEPYATFTVLEPSASSSGLAAAWRSGVHELAFPQGILQVTSYGQQAIASAPSLGIPQIASFGVSGGQAFFSVDCLEETPPDITGGQGGGTSTTTLGLAGRRGRFAGDFGDFIVFFGELSAADRNDIIAFLGQKWGISVGACGDPAAGLALLQVDCPCLEQDFEGGDFSAWTLAGVGNANQLYAAIVDDGGNHELALQTDGATAYYGADNAGFFYQQLTGDFRIETDIDTSTMTTGKEWRKAGLMARASLDEWDIRLLAMLAPIQERLQFVARTSYGTPGNVKLAYEILGVPLQARLAIERVEQTLTVQYSLDGGATWITPDNNENHGSIEILDLPETLYVGLATVSNNISVTSMALFDNVSICPAPAP